MSASTQSAKVHSVSHHETVKVKLQEAPLRKALDEALHLIHKGRALNIERRFADFEGLRGEAAAIKNHALQHLGQLLTLFEKRAQANGFQVHYAVTGNDACAIIADLAAAHGVRHIIKGKSMVSEEIGLLEYLRQRGVETEASDVGDLIVYLTGEPPVHILGPAMHHDRHEIGRIFADHLHVPYTDDPLKLNLIAREHLRGGFAELKMGLSGVNFALAEEGAIWLIENEGNGRMCSTAPDLYVAVCGIEKLVQNMEEACTLATIVPPSANGSFIPAYNNIIAGPRRADELDGPREVHIIMIDNGRTRLLASPDYQAALRCLRCSACMNFCPVFKQVGGHAYLSTYPGPIGTVISPLLQDFEHCGHLLTLCSQCRRCAEVCPVKIPLPELILKLRAEVNASRAAKLHGREARRAKEQRLIFKFFRRAAVDGVLWQRLMRKSYAADFFLRLFGRLLPPGKYWAQARALPRLKGGRFYKELNKLPGVRIE